MVIEIDFQSDEALYTQLMNQIIMGIATSRLQEGDPLPSVRQLADTIGINMHTVNKAYSLLRQEGFVSIDRRKGAVICLDVDKLRAMEELKQNLRVALAGQFFSTAFYLHLSLHEEKTAHKGTDPLSKKAGTDCYRGHGTPNSKKSTDFYGRACNLCRTGHPSTKYRATFDAAL